ncbi:MAG: TIM barrel protein [Angelakisella sp.]
MIDKIGVRAHDYGKASPRKLFAAISNHGWQSVQLAITKAIAGVNSYYDITLELEEQIKAELAASGLSLSVLGAYVELGITDESIRHAEEEKFISQLGTAARLGAGCVATETTAHKKQPNATQEQAMEALRRSLCAILPHAQSLGVTVAVEPVWYHTLSGAELAHQLLKDMACNNLKIVLDPINLLAPESLPSQRLLLERAVELLGEDIVAVHIKGAHVKENEMVSCPLLQSQADIPFVFRLLGRLQQPLAVLREEAVPANSAQDLAYMRSMIR